MKSHLGILLVSIWLVSACSDDATEPKKDSAPALDLAADTGTPDTSTGDSAPADKGASDTSSDAADTDGPVKDGGTTKDKAAADKAAPDLLTPDLPPPSEAGVPYGCPASCVKTAPSLSITHTAGRRQGGARG